VQLHQYAPATVGAPLEGGGRVALAVRTAYPTDGEVVVEVTEAPGTEWTLGLRVPRWAESAVVAVDGEEAREVGPGYAAVRRAFRAGDVVRLRLPVQARWSWPHPRIDALRGQVAVERGPVVLCLESVDLGADVGAALVDTREAPVERDGQILVPMTVLDLEEPAWPYGGSPEHGVAGADGEPRLVPLIPYRQWANRGPSTMRVWMPART
jgi:DUF1680 family protein